MRSRTGGLHATMARWGRHLALAGVLLTAPSAAAQEQADPAALGQPGRVAGHTHARLDARLLPPAAEPVWRPAGEGLDGRPMFTRRGLIIGAVVGCAFGGWKFADAAGDHALGHGVAGCLLLLLPGMFLGGLWIP